MMQFENFPIDSIDIQSRLRYAESDSAKDALENLKHSITKFGLLQPILIDQNNVLLDGWRRFTACRALGWVTVPVYRRERLTDAEYRLLERETNFQRLGFTWQEEVIAACDIHRAHVIEAAKQGDSWTMAMTGDMIGYGKSYVGNCLALEPFLQKLPDGRYADVDISECDGITDALRVLYRRKEDEALQESARRMQLTRATVPVLSVSGEVATTPTLAEQIANIPDLVLGDLLGGGGGGGSQVQPIPETLVDLSHTIFHGSMETLLPTWPADSVDHIISDWPYAIEMDNLQQSNTAMMDMSRVADTHDVQSNLGDIPKWLSSMHHVLKPGGYCILWMDIMNWNYIYETALNVGFKAQRWPLVWCKSHQCKNQMAHVNFTKNTEIAIVLRKGLATLPNPVQTSYILASNDAKLSNPFAKPYLVWKWLVESVTLPGQVILEPFAGEGSGVLSFLKLNRRVLAIEKDERHYNVLLNEVKNHWTSVFKNVKFQ